MARVIVTPQFLEEESVVYLDDFDAHIWDIVDNLEYVPMMGTNKNMPKTIREIYDDEIRKVAVHPFLIVYRYHAEKDECIVLGLMPQRQAY